MSLRAIADCNDKMIGRVAMTDVALPLNTEQGSTVDRLMIFCSRIIMAWVWVKSLLTNWLNDSSWCNNNWPTTHISPCIDALLRAEIDVTIDTIYFIVHVQQWLISIIMTLYAIDSVKWEITLFGQLLWGQVRHNTSRIAGLIVTISLSAKAQSPYKSPFVQKTWQNTNSAWTKSIVCLQVCTRDYTCPYLLGSSR